MKFNLVAPATLALFTLLSGCDRQAPVATEGTVDPAASSGVVAVASSASGASDCFRDRIADYRKMHGTTAPLSEERVAEWLEYCHGR